MSVPYWKVSYDFRRLQKTTFMIHFHAFPSSSLKFLSPYIAWVWVSKGRQVKRFLWITALRTWTSVSVLTIGFCSLVCGGSWAVWGCNITDDYTHLDPDIRRYETTRLGLEGKHKHAHIHTLLSRNNKTGALIIWKQKVSCQNVTWMPFQISCVDILIFRNAVAHILTSYFHLHVKHRNQNVSSLKQW